MMTTNTQTRRTGFKLHTRLMPVAFAFYMAGIMAFLMCLIITAINQGFVEGYFVQVLRAYTLAMPSAFICVMAVRPVVLKLVKWTVHP
ncbi:DUF2798 domain-containing protein [Cellvibrio polysaccharolyticus]|nr:DUF2798 domain-containing protein [Cellvibrio polysaccharolyticus]